MHITKRFVLFLLLFIAITYNNYSQSDSIDYFGQTPPGKIITKFAPGIISVAGRIDYSITFSADGTEMFYLGWDVIKNENFIKYSEKKEGVWQPLSDFDYNQGKPVFAPYERLIYWDNYYSVKSDTGWSDLMNTNLEGQFFSTTLDSILYFKYQGNGTNEIYYSKFDGAEHQTAKPLPYPINYNSGSYIINDPCISPNGDYIIFVKDAADIWYVSFKKAENHWTYPKKLSHYFLNPDHVAWLGLAPTISPDGKYIFCSNWTPTDIDIYWVSASIIDDARNSNFTPYVHAYNKIPDTSAYVGQEFILKINDSTFIDDDGNETLTLSANLTNGNSLPEWLSFDPASITFSGMPDIAGGLSIKVTATDTALAYTSDNFYLNITDPEIVNPARTLSFKVYPNPTDGLICLESPDILLEGLAYQVLDLSGKAFKLGNISQNTIDIMGLEKGLYILKIICPKQTIFKKVILD